MSWGLDKRWLALLVLCLGDLMIVLDTTVVNVALPSIKSDLGFTDTSLVWVVNAYMLTFSGFLLLGGRLGDLFGNRKLFLIGLAFFTVASLACGLAVNQWMLIVARAVQGLGGAVVSAIALSLIMNLFTGSSERAKAMGIFGFVMAGGGSVGAFLGGFLTGVLNWHWIFLINIPIGALVIFLCFSLIEKTGPLEHVKRIDVAGAITVTLSLMLAVFGIVNGNQWGWTSPEILGLLAGAAAIFAGFLYIETHTDSPLVPLSIFSLQNVVPVSVIGILWSAAMFSWFFLSALYMQLVLGFDPLQVGLSFIPANLIMAVFSVGLSAMLVMRFGVKANLTLGMIFVMLGLILFSFAPVNGSFMVHVLPGMLALGLGAGLSFNPVLLAGTGAVPPNESGLASGVLNTAFMMGGSLGLAILASIAASYTAGASAGVDQLSALVTGYSAAFITGAVFAGVAASMAFFFVKEVEVREEMMH